MPKFEKKINKRLIGLVIGTTVVGGLSATKKGQEISKSTAGKIIDKTKNFLEFLKSGVSGLKDSISKKNDKELK